MELGNILHAPKCDGYDGLEVPRYKLKVTVIRRRKAPAHELLPRVHRVASLLKRWILGTHQGAITHSHLAYYLDEFTFRFNRGRSEARQLLHQAVAVDQA